MEKTAKKEFCHGRFRGNRTRLFFRHVVLFFLFSCIWANVVNAQSKTVIQIRAGGLEQALNDVRDKTGYTFFFHQKDLSGLSVEGMNITFTSITDVLDRLLKDLPLDYKIEDKVVIISKKKQLAVEVLKEKRIKGLVVDEKGSPLPGVSIMQKLKNGSLLGASTDVNGRFSFLMALNQGDSLVFSFVGMKTLVRRVKPEETEIEVRMESEMKEMDEVVVTGYQMINAHENVGVTTKINAEDLDFNATKTIEQMLEGKVAGMVISNPSGVVGQRQRVRVRGTSSILGNQEPVWVVDGMVQEDPIPFETSDFNAIADGSGEDTDLIKNFVGNAISWLSPSDIEDITVLKDVAATVLYGVKAANGVIVIRTKRGKAGATSISYSGNLAINEKIGYDKLYMMNSKERTDVARELIESGRKTSGVVNQFGFEYLYNKYLNKEISYQEFEAGVKKLEVQNTDWLDILLQRNISQSHSLNISGGSDKITYYASINISNARSMVKGNENWKYGANLNLNSWIFKDVLRFNFSLRGNITDTKGLNGEDPYTYARKTSRALPAYDENGERHFYVHNNGYLYNIEFENEQRTNENSVSTLNGALSFDWNVYKGLRFNTSLGFGLTHTDGVAFSSERSNYITAIRGYEFGTRFSTDPEYKSSPLPHGGDFKKSVLKNITWTWRNQLDYNFLVKKHRIGVMVGFEMKSTRYEGYDRLAYGYMDDKGKVISLPEFTIATTYDPDVTRDNPLYNSMYDKVTDRLSNYMSYYANVSYSFDERYVLTGSIRADASNRFGQNKKEAFLPVYSFGFRWNVNNEPWMTHINHIFNNIAFRASLGYQGNVAENYGPELIVRYGSGINYYFSEVPLEISRLPYDDLGWEKTFSVNTGADFGFFKNRFQLSFNYYWKRTTDVIVNTEVAYEWGISSMPINDGDLTNSGWDLTVTTSLLRTKNFAWTMSFNTAKNYNKIESTTEKKDDWNEAVSGNLVRTGEAYSTVWAWKYDGVNGENGVPLIALPEEYDPKDVTTWMEKVGKLDPDFTGGLSTSLRYKTLSLSMSFTLNVGAGRWLADYTPTSIPGEYENLRKEAVDRWRKPGDELLPGVKPGLPYSSGTTIMDMVIPTRDEDGYERTENVYRLYNRSDVRFVNADFLKCNNISLNYTFPTKWLKKAKLNTLGCGLSVSNPFKIVSKDFKGVDPEVATGGVPVARTYSLTVNVGF